MDRPGSARFLLLACSVLLVCAPRARGATAGIRPLGKIVPPVTYSPFEGTSVGAEPHPLRPGETGTIVVDVVNRDPAARTVSVRADVGGAALLASVPDGATIAHRPTFPDRTPLGSPIGVIWNDLLVPARSVVTVKCRVIMRYEYAATPLSVRVTVTDPKTSETHSADASFDPVWRKEQRPMRLGLTLLVLATGLLVSTVLWPSAILLWRFGNRPGRKDNVAIHLVTAILLGIGTLMSVILVWTWWSDVRTAGDYRKGTCRVTDRMLVYESRPHRDERPRGFDSDYRYAYRALFAAELMGENERRTVISGDSDSYRRIANAEKASADLRRFEPGREYPCWYSIREPQELLLEPREHGIWAGRLVLLGVLSLLAAPGLIAFVRRRRMA